MSGDLQFGIKLTWDGKAVEGGVTASREQFRQFSAEAKRAGEAASGGFTSAAKGVRSISQQLEEAKLAALGYVTATKALEASRWAIEQVSAIRSIEARVRDATDGLASYHKAIAGISELAANYGAQLGDTSNSFSRLNPAISQLGGTTQTTLRMMDGLMASLKVSGATTQETNAVLLQFSQALGSGVVQGDEFRSLMEAAPPLMREVAKELGVATGRLKQMASDGKLTSEVFGNAVLASVDRLKAKAATIPPTFDQASQAVKNSMTIIMGALANGVDGQPSGGGIASAITAGAEAIRGLEPEARALGSTLQDMSGTATSLAAAWLAWKASARLGPLLEEHGRAAAATLQYHMAVADGRAVMLGSVEAERQRSMAMLESARSSEAQAAVELARIRTIVGTVTAEREHAVATLRSAEATLAATEGIGVYSAALAASRAALVAKSAAMTDLAALGKFQAQVTRELAAAEAALATASAATTAASGRYAAAATAASFAGRAKAAAAGLASGALAALGGPIGATILGLTALATWFYNSASAARELEKQTWQVKKAQDAIAQGKVPEDRHVAAIRAQVSTLQNQLDELEQKGGDADAIGRLKEKIGNLQDTLVYAERAAQAAQSAAAEAGKNSTAALSDPSALDKLTHDLKWREKLVKEHGEALVRLDKAYQAKLKASSSEDQPTVTRNYQAARAALIREQQQALASLPEAKDAAALTSAQLDARQASLKAWNDEYKDTIKRALEESSVDYRDYWTLVEAGERHLAETQIAILQARQRASIGPGRDSEVARYQGEIDALRARLATGISAEVAKGTAEYEAKARAAGSNASKDWQTADDKTLASAAAWRRENLSLIDQELAKAKEKVQLDLQERQAQLEKNEALRHAPEELKKYQQAAEDQAAGTLAALEAEIQARYAANAAWETGADRALTSYLDQVRDVASQSQRAWTSAFQGMEDAAVKFVRQGKLDFRSFADSVIDDLIRMQVREAETKVLGAIKDAGGMSGIASSIGNWVQGLFSANGNVFNSGHVLAFANGAAFSNQVVDRPTSFNIGVMGEAGPEAIMPLARDGSGRLGVRASGNQSAGVTIVQEYNITMQGTGDGEKDAKALATTLMPMMKNVAESTVFKVMSRERRPGGVLSGS